MAGLIKRVVAEGYWETAAEIPARREPIAGPWGDPRSNGSHRPLARLVRAIEVEVIPRLVLARRAAPEGASPQVAKGLMPAAEEVAEFTDRVLARDSQAAYSFVDDLRARGASVDTVYLDLLAPAARRLGEMWTADRCHFTDVTLGVGRMQRVLHELGPDSGEERDHGEPGPRALLAPVPGDQHTFGLFMVAEFFRRGGWDVWSGPSLSSKDLAGVVRREWFAVIGLSVSSDRQLGAAASCIQALRRASRNRSVGVLVGGPIFVERPETAALVGADATAVDGRQAVLQAHNVLTLLTRRA